MAATKQPGFRAGASAAAALDDSPVPSAASGTERADTIFAKRKLSMRTKPLAPKAASASRQKSFSSGRAASATKSAPYVKKLSR